MEYGLRDRSKDRPPTAGELALHNDYSVELGAIRQRRINKKEEISMKSDHVQEHFNAQIFPMTRFQSKTRGATYNGGVYDANGGIIEHAIERSRGYIHAPDASPELVVSETLPGTYLFGGYLPRHFGNFLTQSLGRLWPYERFQQRISGVIFIHYSALRREWNVEAAAVKAEQTIGQPFVQETFKLLNIDVPIRIIGPPVRVERLLIPRQMHMIGGERVIGRPTAFFKFLQRAVRKHLVSSSEAADRLYVSKAQFGTGNLILEENIEANLAEQGYKVIHPEKLSVFEQVGLYAHAERLIFCEGSAIHMAAMLDGRGKRSAVIYRRSPERPQFKRQFEWAQYDGITEVRGLRGLILPTDPSLRSSPRHINNSRALLDFQVVAETLAQAGFCDAARWKMPNRQEVAEAVRQSIDDLEAKYPGIKFGLFDAHIPRSGNGAAGRRPGRTAWRSRGGGSP